MPSKRGKADNGDTTPQPMEGEFRSGPVAGTAMIAGVTFARKGVAYAEVDNLAIFEGDIVLGTMDEMRAAADTAVQFSIGITGQQFRWPNATIPYELDAGLPNQQRVTDAIAHWEANTRIRFVLRTAQNAGQYPDYVHFQTGGGCSSMVGRRGGPQNITLGNGCSTGNAIHEIGHAVGLWHEQSREDRDTFVQIMWANIDPNMQHNFLQHIADGDDLGPYDYGSIMHYPPTAFSINGQATIVALQALPPGVVMGQRNGLSQGDIDGVHTMYPRDVVTLKEVGKDPFPETLKEVGKDPFPETIKEVGKDPIQDTFKEVGKDPIQDTFKEVGKDPIQDTLIEQTGTWVEQITTPGQLPFPGGMQPGFRFGGGMQPGSPFVLATPSQYGGPGGAGMDMLTQVTAQLQAIAQALELLERQQAEIRAAYEAAVQAVNALQRGQR